MENENAARSLCAAITSKAAGDGLLGATIPAHTLRVRGPVEDDNPHPTIYMWTDDPSLYLDDEPRMPPIPQTRPFCQYMMDHTANGALELICSTAPGHLGSIRTLIITHYNEDNPWMKYPNQDHFWSGSLACLVGLEVLYLDSIVWDGLGTPIVPIVGGILSAGLELPFPRLRLLSLSRICFRMHSPSHPDHRAHANDFIYSLKGMLLARKNAGTGLAKFVVSSGLHFCYEDFAMLGAYWEEVKWDGIAGEICSPKYLPRY